jgi:hypothetical protein
MLTGFMILSTIILFVCYDYSLLAYPPIDLDNLQEKLQTFLIVCGSGASENFLKFIFLIIISIGKYILLEYDIVGMELQLEDLNLTGSAFPSGEGCEWGYGGENTFLELRNKQDAYSSSDSSEANTNPYSSLTKTVQGQQFLIKLVDNWLREFDPGGNRHVTNTIYFNSYMNQPKGVEERYGVDNGPGGKHVLRIVHQPVGVKYHIHGGYIAPNSNIEICVYYTEKEFNPLPFPLHTPYSTPNYPYQGAHMLDGIGTSFDPNWPKEVKDLYWKAVECNYRAMSERILAGHYPLHDNKVIMHDDMSKKSMDLCWKYRFNRDLNMNKMNEILNKKT